MEIEINEYKKRRLRGIIYIFLGAVGLGYEIFFAEQARFLVIIGYSAVILLGFFYISFFRNQVQDFNKSK